MRNKKGFTLIELLVSVSVISILFGLLLPAIQNAREASRRIQCANNLKQIGVALHNYHSALDSLPWGDGPDQWNQWSAIALILPYIDQAALNNSINYSYGFQDWRLPYNTTAQQTKLSFATCPSDVDRMTDFHGHLNYSGNAGTAPASFYDWDNTGAFDGLFGWSGNSRRSKERNYVKNIPTIGFRDVRDGLSNTVMYSEKVKGIGTATNARVDDPLKPSAAIALLTKPLGADLINPQSVYNQCRQLDPSVPSTAQNRVSLYPNGYLWHNGCPTNSRYNHVMPPNTWSCSYGLRWGDAGGAHTASSRHVGVVNTLFADGSVKSITDSININTWWSLGTRAGSD